MINKAAARSVANATRNETKNVFSPSSLQMPDLACVPHLLWDPAPQDLETMQPKKGSRTKKVIGFGSMNPEGAEGRATPMMDQGQEPAQAVTATPAPPPPPPAGSAGHQSMTRSPFRS